MGTGCTVGSWYFVWARVGVCVGVVAKTIAVPGRVAGGSFLRGGV